MKEENSTTPDKTTNSSNTQDVMNAYFTVFDQVVADVDKQYASLELRIMQLQPLRAHSKARKKANADSQTALLKQRLILLPAEKKCTLDAKIYVLSNLSKDRFAQHYIQFQRGLPSLKASTGLW